MMQGKLAAMRLIISLAIYPFLLLMFLVAGCGINNSLVEEYNDFGIKSAKMELWNEATMRWRRVVEMEPDNSQAHNNLGVAYESTGKLEAARVEYEKAIELDPDSKIYKTNYGRFRKNYERSTKKKQDSGLQTQDTRHKTQESKP
jgi:tetratricopeptide (TPR) repeat protein